MKWKKMLAVLSALCVITAGAVGCASDEDSSEKEKTESSVAAESEDAPAEESADAETEEETSEETSEEASSEAETEEAPVAETVEEVSQILYEDATVRITYTGLDTENWLGDGLKVTVENLSDRNITVQTREVSVNGAMEDPYFSCDVAAGKTAQDAITFSIDEEIGVVELSFYVYDSDSWDTIVETDTITITVDESVSVEKADATLIYEANGVTVSYVGINEDDIWGTEFDFLIENNGEETYTVQADNISIDGVMYDGLLYTEVAAGKYANDSMSFMGDDLPAEMNALEFTLRIVNGNYETIAESDPITIDLQ